MLFIIYLVNHQYDWLVRFSQHSRQLLIDRRQAFLSIDDEKKKVAFSQRVFGDVLHLLGQFGFACAENPAGVPQCKRAFAANTGCRKPVARDPGLVMNNRNFSASQTVETRRPAYIRTSENSNLAN